MSDVPLLAFSLAMVLVDRIVVLASTSIFGMRVRRQAADGGDPRLGDVAGVGASCCLENCGRARHNAQVSRTPRPVIVPICRVTRPARRAVAFRSTPCQYAVRVSPATVSSVVWKLREPRAAAAGVIATNDSVPPAFGRSGWLGTGTVHTS